MPTHAKPNPHLPRSLILLFALPLLGGQPRPAVNRGNLNLVVGVDGSSLGPLGSYDLPDHGHGATGNVFRLFQNLEGQLTPGTAPASLEQEKVARNATGGVEQIAYYQAGLATTSHALENSLELNFGLGLVERVVRGYVFLSRNYAPGDRIYLVGFSRGAYAARALAGLIDQEGLLDPRKVDLSDPAHARRVGPATWLRHQGQIQTTLSGRLQALAEELPALLGRAPDPKDMVRAPIQGVAVWDTVGAMGIPAFASDGRRIDTFRFVEPNLPPTVAWGLQAVSVDEQREDFTPSLWNPGPRVTQVLFPGTHRDVGGGATPAATKGCLADLALVWMTRELARRGLRFAAAPAYVATPDPLSPGHEYWLGSKRPVGPRVLPAGLSLHASILARIQGGPVAPDPSLPPAPYDPPSLEGTYLDHGRVRPGVTVVP